MNCKKCLEAAGTALIIVIAILLLTQGALAATKYKTLYKFTGGKDGQTPYASLTLDAAGNLYGTTFKGGAYGKGTVFELTPKPTGGWKESVLHSFKGKDGIQPRGGLIFDSAGNLYGTTEKGGILADCDPGGCGTVFKLTPNSGGGWTESVLYSFTNSMDGLWPYAGVIFDSAGNLFGTAYLGGPNYEGVVFELAPTSNGPWTKSLLYSFGGGLDKNPAAGLVFDSAGNLYGTTSYYSSVYELTPNLDGEWTLSTLREINPTSAGVTLDAAGNLYGTTSWGGSHYYGTVYKLTRQPNGNWTLSSLHDFNGKDGSSPYAGVILDSAGNLYGNTYSGGAYGYGVVFKLTPTSTGGWTYRVLHTFRDAPGAAPYSNLTLDAAGNLYGTTAGDGKTTFGSVFEITP